MTKPAAAAASSSWMRLNKLVARSGACSRREADKFLSQGWVHVAGLTREEIMRTPGQKVPPGTDFQFLPSALEEMNAAVSLILHKPLGVVSSQPEGPEQFPAIKLLTAEHCFRRPKQQQQRQQQYDSNAAFNHYPNHPHRLSKLAVAGRLDAQSSGLLLFTQSGKLAQTVIGPDTHIEKEYLVRITSSSSSASSSAAAPQQLLLLDQDDQVTESTHERIQRLLEGVSSEGDFLEATDIRVQNADQINVTLQGGKYHHIRRMCQAVGWQVQALKRVRIGNIRLQDLPLGKWRYLSADECNELR